METSAKSTGQDDAFNGCFSKRGILFIVRAIPLIAKYITQMMKFSEYIDFRWDKLITEDLDQHQPLDGYWEKPLDQLDQYGTARYFFSVAGDDCKQHVGNNPNTPCYAVNISGNPASEVSVSFSRRGSYSDQHRGVGMDVFRAVLKAMNDYIKAKKPAALSWSPVLKSQANPHTTNPERAGKIINPEARKHVYEKWATRHLFPDKYVGLENKWIRRDLYDKDYVPNGFPPVPPEVGGDASPSVKAATLEDMQNKAKANQAEIDRLRREREEAEYRRQREEAEARQREQERIRRERMEAAMSDTTQNPNGIKKDDIVYIQDLSPSDGEHMRHIAKVIDMRLGRYGDGTDLMADLRFADNEDDNNFNGYSDIILARRLQKETPESRSQREQRYREMMQALISSPQYNPHGVQEGDQIMTYLPNNPTSNQHGLLGVLKKFVKQTSWSATYLKAQIDWDEHAKEVLGTYQSERAVEAKNLKKATPEEIEALKRQRREHEIEQEVQRNRERQQRHANATAAPAGHEDEPFSDELLNHSANPEHLKPGDYVVTSDWRNRGRKGIIISIRKTYWDENSLEATVKFHNSRVRYNPTIRLNYVNRDTSPEALDMQRRATERAARAQAVQAGSAGHNIGDEVTVASGLHRGKTGRIVNFRRSGQNVTAVVAAIDGSQFNVSVRSLRPPLRIAQPETENPSAPADGSTAPVPPNEWYRPLSFSEYHFIRSQEPEFLL